MGANDAAMEQVRAAMESSDMGEVSQVLRAIATDDFVQEWPQSGERIVGKEASIKLDEAYQGATGTSPKMTFGRMLGGGDIYVVEGTIDYGDGTPSATSGSPSSVTARSARSPSTSRTPSRRPNGVPLSRADGSRRGLGAALRSARLLRVMHMDCMSARRA